MKIFSHVSMCWRFARFARPFAREAGVISLFRRSWFVAHPISFDARSFKFLGM
jgi:hypothetical protein